MYELSGNQFIQKSRQYGDVDGQFAALVDQKQDSYIVIGSPTTYDSYKIRKINISRVKWFLKFMLTDFLSEMRF